MDMSQAVQAVVEKKDLSADDMIDIMRLIMTGQATPAQIGGFLVGLRMKGETVDEIAAAAGVMRGLAAHVDVHCEHLVDTCGTGGDGLKTFNISTASAIVAASAGAHVAKHGNRSFTSKSGSADVLEAAGVNLDLSPEQVAGCIEETGVGFMFAPKHHAATKHALAPRREMGIRTIFNVLGPLTNPAGAPAQVLGVYSREWLEPLARVLAKLGSTHVLVVHGDDGLDEISISAPTQIAEWIDGKLERYTITPEQFGLLRADASALAVDSPQQSLALINAVFSGGTGPARDIVVLNAAAALYAADVALSLEEGVERAQQVLSDGAAQRKFQEFIAKTNSFNS